MRNALVTLSGAGLLASLLFSSCVIKEKSNDGEGGTSSGGSVSVTGGRIAINAGGSANVGGRTNNSGKTLAEECPDLLTTLNPGEPGVCSQSQAAAEFNQINMLIVMDKSGSMNTQPAGYSKTKWAGAVDSLKSSLDPQDPLVQYGFMLFPYLDGGTVTSCELADGELAVNVPVGPASETVDRITELMSNVVPGGGTPTANALGAALDYYTKGKGVSLVGSKYVLLVTDGGPNCNDTVVCGPETCTANMDKSPATCGSGVPNCCDIDIWVSGRANPQSLCLDDQAVVGKIQALAAAGIKTFVVGIPGTEAYSTYLDTFAEEGGVPVTDATKTHKYYEVTGESGLAEAFKSITTSLVRSCTVPLEQKPMDTDNINVAIDCNPVPQKTGDVANWHYDATVPAIVVEGGYCARIEQAGVKRVDIVLGCPPFNPI